MAKMPKIAALISLSLLVTCKGSDKADIGTTALTSGDGGSLLGEQTITSVTMNIPEDAIIAPDGSQATSIAVAFQGKSESEFFKATQKLGFELQIAQGAAANEKVVVLDTFQVSFGKADQEIKLAKALEFEIPVQELKGNSSIPDQALPAYEIPEPNQAYSVMAAQSAAPIYALSAQDSFSFEGFAGLGIISDADGKERKAFQCEPWKTKDRVIFSCRVAGQGRGLQLLVLLFFGKKTNVLLKDNKTNTIITAIELPRNVEVGPTGGR